MFFYMNRQGFLRRLLAAGVLSTTAAALWLSAGGAGVAATATQTQNMTAAVSDQLAWGSAGTCNQAMGTASFPTTAAGSGSTVGGFRGCITSNKSWNVNVAVTSPLTSADDGSTIPASGSNYQISTSGTTPAGAAKCAAASPCSMPAATPGVAAVTGASKSSGSNAQPFDYSLTLNVPSGATGGNYTGGVLTFTASN